MFTSYTLDYVLNCQYHCYVFSLETESWYNVTELKFESYLCDSTPF